jgi:hypothetical protein
MLVQLMTLNHWLMVVNSSQVAAEGEAQVDSAMHRSFHAEEKIYFQ